MAAGSVDHIKANMHLLRATATNLGQVANELTATRATIEADAAALAQADLTAALGEFSDNWKIRRENLIEAVQGAHAFMTTAIGCYEKLDQQLCAAVTPEGQ